MFNLSDDALKAIASAIVAVCGVVAAVIKKKRSKISDRRASSVHTLRHEKYVFEHAYYQARAALDDVREEVAIALRLKAKHADWSDLPERLQALFPNNTVPDYVENFRRQLNEAERLQRAMENEEE